MTTPAKCAQLRAEMTSLRSFRTNDAPLALYSHHGEISIAPARACESTGGGGMDGSGWRMWDMSCKARFPPAESPPMTIFAGEMPLFRRCDNAALACLNWVGRGDSGAKARFGVIIESCAPGPDRTHSIPTQRRQHLPRKPTCPSEGHVKIENNLVARGRRTPLLPTNQMGEN